MKLSNTARWSLAALVAVIALIVALWPRGADDGGDRQVASTRGESSSVPSQQEPGDPVPGLAACPRNENPSSMPAGPLSGITVECLSDGTVIDFSTESGHSRSSDRTDDGLKFGRH